MNADTTVEEVISCEEFRDFGKYIFPRLSDDEKKIPLSHLTPLYPRCSCLNTVITLKVLSFMSERASRERIFYNLYTDAERKRDPDKTDAGLFYFRGLPGAPFAIISPGETTYGLTSLHESLPAAMLLNESGFHVFSLHYRSGNKGTACEDLATAITFAFEHATHFCFDTERYALWGSGTGADIAAYLTSYGPHAFGGGHHPRPGLLVMQYTPHHNHTRQEPPTFACVGEDDPLCDWQIMKHRIDALAECGIHTEFHKYPRIGHGFGLGIGSSAESWFHDASVFWKRHLSPRTRRLLRRSVKVSHDS